MALNTIPVPAMSLHSESLSSLQGVLIGGSVTSPMLHVPDSSESLELFNLSTALRAIDTMMNEQWFVNRETQPVTRSAEEMRDEILGEQRNWTL
jgi:hypothetical protein